MKRPADTNKRAKTIVDIATGEIQDTPSKVKNQAAVELGRKGGVAKANKNKEKHR